MIITIEISWLFPFLNSNFFVALITFLSVVSAIVVYKRQKRDEKIEASRIILIEITDLENLLDSIKTNGINLTNIRQIIPSNSWNKYKHLFALDFDERSFKLIDNFYTDCNLLNKELIEAYNLPMHWQNKAKALVNKHISYSESSKTENEYKAKKKKLEFFEKDSVWWQPNAPTKQIVDRVKLIKYISSTTTGKKLKEVAGL